MLFSGTGAGFFKRGAGAADKCPPLNADAKKIQGRGV